MAKIISARAWANNEVAYIAWRLDGKIPGCLGFEVTRVYLNAQGKVARRPDGKEDRVRCAAWVAFKGQHNPHWIPQDTGVWPVQKLSWRDLTLRKRRDKMTRRPSDAHVRYEIRPVGDLKPGLTPVPPNGHDFASVAKRDKKGRPIKKEGKTVTEKVPAYDGPKRPLGYLAPAFSTNDIHVTAKRGNFRSTFTNGILAAQWLRNVLNEDGVIEKDELINKIRDPADPHRKYLAGDVIPLITDFLKLPGTFYLALYELDDEELVSLLVAHAPCIHIILSNSGLESKEWDVRNRDARQRLVDAHTHIQHRMFNNSTGIGHNKFVLHVPPNGKPRAVLTGSTNWTSTGLAGQTNNALILENGSIAKAFLEYWKRLESDALPLPSPLSEGMSANNQGAALRTANATGFSGTLPGGARIKLWFSPNRPERRYPKYKDKPTPVPPDLADVFRLMRLAKEAILFLAFYPSQTGKDSIIGEAINIGIKDSQLLVTGAVSSPMAMPNYVPTQKDEDENVIQTGASPYTYDNGNVSLVRAAAIDDHHLLGDLGMETLTARQGFGAIIHDKLVVIDPRSPDCTVILGSHNLGYKASYSNDENLVIVQGDPALAAAYAVHILDVYDHYRFRAVEADLARKKKKGWSGFLDGNDTWQSPYLTHKKGALSDYFAQP
ncbi:MAG: phospholipase D-like domain-containing protein [Fibrobacteria bacterium]